MPANKVIRLGPIALTNAVTNLINPPIVSGGSGLAGTNSSTYLIIKRIRIVNKSSSDTTFTLYIGVSGGSVAGTEFMGGTKTIPANRYEDFVCYTRLDVADFLTGIASANTALILEASAEIGVA